MISCYFGVPRVGKNTLATKFARRGLVQRIGLLGLAGRKRYDHVLTDFPCQDCEQIDFQKLGQYKFYNSLIIFGEMALEADNREFKKFAPEIRDFLVLHAHLGNDIIYLTQDYSNVDKKIRMLTEELWYLTKSVVPVLREFTCAKRIYRCITINEHTGDLVMGYRFCNLLERFFVSNYKIVYRRKYYKYFDSWEEGVLEPRKEYKGVIWSFKPRPKVSVLSKLRALVVKSDKVA